MPHANINGINVYYEEHGRGFPLIMSHGYSATCQMWAPQIEAFARHYRFVAWDMRGHGQTDSPAAPQDYSEAHTVADMRQLLIHLGVQQAVVGGLSLGGYMSLAFYLAHPQMVRALVLCDTGPGYRNPAARERWNRRAEARALAFEAKGLEALGQSPEIVAGRRSHRSAAGLARAARGMLAQFDSRVIDSLSTIAVPTLVIVGERDEPFRAAADYMTTRIPGARQVVIPGAGHAANIDQPEAFNQAVLGFLEEVGLG